MTMQTGRTARHGEEEQNLVWKGGDLDRMAEGRVVGPLLSADACGEKLGGIQLVPTYILSLSIRIRRVPGRPGGHVPLDRKLQQDLWLDGCSECKRHWSRT